MNLGKRLEIHFQESNTLKPREANEPIRNAHSVRRVPTRVITIFPPTTFTVRRTKSRALMPFRPSWILRVSFVRLPSGSRTILSPSLRFATRSPRLPHFAVVFTVISRRWSLTPVGERASVLNLRASRAPGRRVTRAERAGPCPRLSSQNGKPRRDIRG
jgi:hypothetical protein